MGFLKTLNSLFKTLHWPHLPSAGLNMEPIRANTGQQPDTDAIMQRAEEFKQSYKLCVKNSRDPNTES